MVSRNTFGYWSFWGNRAKCLLYLTSSLALWSFDRQLSYCFLHFIDIWYQQIENLFFRLIYNQKASTARSVWAPEWNLCLVMVLFGNIHYALCASMCVNVWIHISHCTYWFLSVSWDLLINSCLPPYNRNMPGIDPFPYPEKISTRYSRVRFLPSALFDFVCVQGWTE